MSGSTKLASGNSSLQKSTRSATRRGSSRRVWQKPTTALAVAEQAADVSTQLLNGKVELETAKGYASLIRGIAQLLTAEIQKARLDRRPASLSLTKVVEAKKA